jgi:hypothetical protein
MKARWYYTGRRGVAGPIDSPQLRRLAAEGAIGPTDWVRRGGSRRWVPAGKIEGLFNGDVREWYCTANGRQFGPITFRQLRKQAESGSIRPDDMIWKPGMSRWKRAAKVVGLFSEPAPTATPRGMAAGRCDRARALEQCDPSRAGAMILPWEFPVDPSAGWSNACEGAASRGEADPTPSRRSARDLALPALIVIVASIVGVRLLTRDPASAPTATSPANRPAPAPAKPNRVAAITPDRPVPGPSARQPGPRSSPEIRSDAEPAKDDAAAGRPRSVVSATAGAVEAGAPTPEDERRVGREVHELIVARHKVLDDETLRRRLVAVISPLLAERGEDDRPISFTILDAEEAFTFSHPGGYLYVSRALFNFARNDAELQFILGVEVAHLDLGHLSEEATRAGREAVVRGDAPLGLARRLYRQIALGYNEEQVFEADARACRAVCRLGVPRYRTISWLATHYDFNGSDDPRGTRRRPSTGPSDDRQDVANHWPSQPPAPERYNRLRSLVVATNP